MIRVSCGLKPRWRARCITRGNRQANGTGGTSGNDGAEIDSVAIDEAGILTLFMTDFTTRTASGPVVGPAGADGSSCSVAGDGNTVTVTCTDGTSATVTAGSNGNDGNDGLDGLNARARAAGDDCEHGGSKIESGQDTNADGQLDFAEVTTTSLCAMAQRCSRRRQRRR